MSAGASERRSKARRLSRAAVSRSGRLWLSGAFRRPPQSQGAVGEAQSNGPLDTVTKSYRMCASRSTDVRFDLTEGASGPSTNPAKAKAVGSTADPASKQRVVIQAAEWRGAAAPGSACGALLRDHRNRSCAWSRGCFSAHRRCRASSAGGGSAPPRGPLCHRNPIRAPCSRAPR